MAGTLRFCWLFSTDVDLTVVPTGTSSTSLTSRPPGQENDSGTERVRVIAECPVLCPKSGKIRACPLVFSVTRLLPW